MRTRPGNVGELEDVGLCVCERDAGIVDEVVEENGVGGAATSVHDLYGSLSIGRLVAEDAAVLDEESVHLRVALPAMEDLVAHSGKLHGRAVGRILSEAVHALGHVWRDKELGSGNVGYVDGGGYVAGVASP